MSFIQVQQSLVTHRKTLRLARLLSLDRYAVVGRLVALWSWCLDNALDGCLGDDIDADVLADVMAWDATLGKPAELLEALLTAGFLELDSDDGRLYIHDWHEHMGRLIEKREQSAERMRKMRARKADTADAEQGDPASDTADTTNNGGGEAVTRTLRARYAHVAPQEKSRVEQSRVTHDSEHGSPERERAPDRSHDVTLAADAALSPSTAPAPSSSDSRSSPATKSAKPTAKVTPLPTAHSVPRPATHSARVPDPVWDACIAAMGAAPSNRVERGKWAKGIQALKESLAVDGSPPTEIVTRSHRYRARFGTSVPLNPMALAGNWTTLAHDITPTAQEGQRHGNFGNLSQRSGQSRHDTAGRRDGRRDGRPAIGTPAYYAQAAQAQRQAGADTGGASGEGVRAAAVGEW